MAARYERPASPYFWIRFQKLDGTWGAKSSGIRKDAQGATREIKQAVAEHTMREQDFSDGSTAHRFDSWVPAFLKRRYTDPKTLRRYLNAWAALATYLAHRDVISPLQITYKLCTDYPAFRTNPPKKLIRASSHNTALLELKVLSAILQEAVRREYIKANPCVRLGLKKQPPKQKPEITPDEIAQIETALATRDEWMRDSWFVAMRQGCRFSETAVPLSQIDTIARTIRFRIKGGREHTAPLHPDLVPLVDKAKKAKRKTLVELPQYAGKVWWHFFRQIDLPHLCFHCTRVTVITKLARTNAPESHTMAYVGHANETVHAIYRRLKAADVAHLAGALSNQPAEK